MDVLAICKMTLLCHFFLIERRFNHLRLYFHLFNSGWLLLAFVLGALDRLLSLHSLLGAPTGILGFSTDVTHILKQKDIIFITPNLTKIN